MEGRRKHTLGSRAAGRGPQWLYAMPLAAVLVVLPLIVRFRLFETGLGDVPWTNTGPYATDLYLYWKSRFFMAVSAWMAATLLMDRRHVGQLIGGRGRHLSFWLLLGGYLALVLLSALASGYPAYAWGGSIGQFEPTPVLFGYVTAGFYAYVYCHEGEVRRKIPLLLMLSAGAMGAIGAFQYAGHDLFALPAVQRLLMPGDVFRQSGGISFAMEGDRVYLTLYNPNYAGVYCACMLAVSSALLATERAPRKRLAYAAVAALMGVSLVGSRSKTGAVVASLAVAVALLLHVGRALPHWKGLLRGRAAAVFFVGAAAIFLAGAAAIFLAGAASSQPATSQGGALGLLREAIGGILPARSEYRLTALYTDAGGIHFTYDGIAFSVRMEAGAGTPGVSAERVDGVPVDVAECTDGSAHFILASEGLPDIPVCFMGYQGVLCMDVVLDGGDWIVTDQIPGQQAGYLYLNRCGRFDSISMPETALLTDCPSWLTYRGFIWARSLPLLWRHPFLGGGADTFLMEYPNDDYLGMHQTGTYGEFTTRPHSWYLQAGIQTGALSLLLVLAALSLYARDGVRCLARAVKAGGVSTRGTDADSRGTGGKAAHSAGTRAVKSGGISTHGTDADAQDKQRLCTACFLGSMAILLMDLLNDSSICTSPLLWCLIGTAMACMEESPKKRRRECPGGRRGRGGKGAAEL